MVSAQMLAVVQDILVGGFVVFALLLTVIGALAYQRTKIKKLLFVSLGFGLFLLKGLILTVAFFVPLFDWFMIPVEFMLPFDILLVLDFLILVILYLATFKK
jgi:hypothetical protein